MRLSHLALLAFSVSLALPAAAQDNDLDTAAERTAACLQIEEASERLACFEAAAAGLNDALKRGDAAQRSDTPASEENAVAAAPAPETDTASAAPAPAPAPAPASPAVAAAAASSEADSAEDADEEKTPIWARVFKREDQKDREPDRFEVSVERILRNNVGRHFFIMSNGQEWKQTEIGKISPPSSLPAVATIRQGMFGSTWISFEDGYDLSYKVERVR